MRLVRGKKGWTGEEERLVDSIAVISLSISKYLLRNFCLRRGLNRQTMGDGGRWKLPGHQGIDKGLGINKLAARGGAGIDYDARVY